jgi:hypothetical protein
LGWQHVPVIGMLKLTREKGSELFLALAAHMPALQFRAVCAEPGVRQQAASAGLTNMQLVPPAGELCCGFVCMLGVYTYPWMSTQPHLLLSQLPCLPVCTLACPPACVLTFRLPACLRSRPPTCLPACLLACAVVHLQLTSALFWPA